MPSDSPSSSGRRHFHRGRRGHDRRSGDRRAAPHAPAEQAPRGDHVDVEQIMREIRSKIAQRHGVELTDQQVQELAARRLESILDLRTIKPGLLDQLRRNAGARPDSVAAADRAAKPYEFEDSTLYESPSALTRFLRRLLNPVLKLFFNPNPLIRALHIQSQLNAETARREAERDQRQAEWNALHYELLHRMVSETAKVTLEVQNLALKVESLSTKVDFNERRVRGIEGVIHQPRSGAGRERDRDREREREREPAAIGPAAPPPAPVGEPAAAMGATVAVDTAAGEAPRRRRRRRRGRRGSGAAEGAPQPGSGTPVTADVAEPEDVEGDELDVPETGDVVTTGTEDIDQIEAGHQPPQPLAPERVTPEPLAPERVTPQLAVPDPVAREEAAPEVPEPGSPKAGDEKPTGA